MSRRISFAKDTLTRPDYTLMAGFCKVRNALSTSTECFPDRTDLFVRCLVIWDGAYPNVIVSADVLGFPRGMHQRIRERVTALREFGRKWDFVLAATHTHNGPVLVDSPSPTAMYGLTDLEPVRRYSEWLETRIVDVVERALGSEPVDCTLEHAVGKATFAVQRATASWTETDVPVLIARRTGPGAGTGRPIAAILFSYGCHPLSRVATCWDGDFPARACLDLEKDTCDFALFVQGPGGDQDPYAKMAKDGHGKELPDAEKPAFFAKLLSDAVRAVTGSGRTLRGSIQSAYRDVDLPLDIPDDDHIGELRDAYVKATLDRRFCNGAYGRHVDEMVGRINTGTYRRTVPLPVLVWHFVPPGDPPFRIVFVGGELVAGYAAELRKHCGGRERVMVVGYANEVPCYVPSYELLPAGNPDKAYYEGGWTPGSKETMGIASGSQAFYGHVGHFVGLTSIWGRKGEGIEDVLFPVLCEMVDAPPS